MFTQKLADRKCGMNTQAHELLQRLSDEIITTEVFLTTSPYCNGREMGFVVSAMATKYTPQTNFAFYEHRNCDQLCVLKWEGNTSIHGAVTHDQIPEGIFPNKWACTAQWSYGNYDDIIDWLKGEIKQISDTYETQSQAAKNDKI